MRLEVVERLAARLAAVQRLARGRAELRQERRRGRSAARAGHHRAPQRADARDVEDLHSEDMRRRDAERRDLRLPSGAIQSVVHGGDRRVTRSTSVMPMDARRSRMSVAIISVAGQPEYVGVTSTRRRPPAYETARTMPSSTMESAGTSGSGMAASASHARSTVGAAAAVAGVAASARCSADVTICVTTARRGTRAGEIASRRADDRDARYARPACRRAASIRRRAA